MRPLSLRLAGFRSYRTPREVSFRELDLVAIIGDTGAGKSSLLEAMTWALYGASTWSRRTSTELLAHGARRMSVEMEFEAGGKEWRVLRTFARSGGGGAELECLSDPTIAKVDGVRQVDPKIEELLGLSYDVFCSCVLLPQGKFERLLKATRGERTDTLKSILRLEQLQEARALAERYAGLVGERERELLEARVRFRPAPAAEAAAAEAELARLAPERDRLDGVAERVVELVESCKQHGRRADDATSAADRLAARRGTRSATLHGLVEIAEELESQLADARRSADEAGDRAAALEHHHAAAQRDGLDAASLVKHEGTVERMRSALSRHSALEARIDADEQDLATRRSLLDGAREALTAADGDLVAHEDALKQARTDAEDTERSLREAETAVDALEAAVAAEAVAQEHDAAMRLELTRREADHAAAKERLEAALAARADATAAYQAAVRDDAAAHAAVGCKPGDPCPICERELPAGFAPPVAPGLDAAVAALESAEAHAAEVADEERAAAVALAGAAERAAAAEEGLRKLEQERAAAASRVASLPGVPEGDVLAAGRSSREALAEATARALERVDELTAARDRASEERGRRRDEVTRAEAAADALAKAVAERREQVRETAGELETAAASLPTWAELDPAAVDAGAVDAAGARIAARLESAQMLERDREEARSTVTAAAGKVAELRLARESQVSTPAAAIRADLVALTGELPPASRDALMAPGADAAPADLAAFAEAVERAVDARVAELRSLAEESRAALERDTERGRALVADAGFEDSCRLAERRDELRAAVLAAQRELRSAAAQIEGAAQLDGMIGQAKELREGFQALKDALADGAFVGYVVARRQRALLGYASKVLADISGRYAFTEDFRILDSESGLPRSPDTLSGGETFIASLALALGLVEVADRSGGDLRALFLDEGFGTLDAAILETAISALEERARSGRLIGVISHVPTVAERIDTVIEVRHGMEGSSVSILSAAEREQRVLDATTAAAAAA